MKTSPELKVWLGILLYTTVFTAIFTWRIQASPHVNGDSAIFSQAFHNTLFHGQLFMNSVESGGHFGVHFTPSFFLLLPLYALWPTIYTLGFLQSAAIALGAWPLFRLASRHLGTSAGVTFACLYLLYYPLHGVNFDDWNENSFMPAPMLFVLDAMDRRSWPAFWAWAVVAMGFKEEVGLTISLLGLYMILVRKDKGQGLMAGVVGVTWFMVSIVWLLPHFRPQGDISYFKDFFGHLGPTPHAALVRLLTDPGYVIHHVASWPNLTYVVEMALPLAFLPWTYLPLLAVSAPTWAVNLLSGQEMTHLVGRRYQGGLVAFVFAAAVFGLARMGEPTRTRFLKAATVLSVLCVLVLDPTPLRVPFRFTPYTRHTWARLEMTRDVPEYLTVAAQSDLLPFVCDRERWVRFGDDPKGDVVLVDPTSPIYVQNHWEGIESNPAYRLVREQDGVRMYARQRRRSR